MSGVTTGGWPYILPADHPLEYPATTQQLATKLDALGLRAVTALKSADQSGIASGAGAGFTATLANVPAGHPVIGIIHHVGTLNGVASEFLTAAWTGVTGAGTAGTQHTAAANAYHESNYIGLGTATGGNVTLTYSIASANPAHLYSVNGTRSSITLISL